MESGKWNENLCFSGTLWNSNQYVPDSFFNYRQYKQQYIDSSCSTMDRVRDEHSQDRGSNPAYIAKKNKS